MYQSNKGTISHNEFAEPLRAEIGPARAFLSNRARKAMKSYNTYPIHPLCMRETKI